MSIVFGIVVLAWILSRQVRARPLDQSSKLPLILLVIGILEFGAYLTGGGQQFASIVKGHRAFSTIPDARVVVIAAVGSIILAAITGALRVPTVRLWRQDGETWRKGTWVTAVAWLVSLGVHLGYDAIVAHGTRQSSIGNATMLIFFAVSLGVQQVILTARARRLDPAPSNP